MTKKERMYHAIHHQPVDKVPKGELAIDAALANRLLLGGYSEEFQDFERELAVRELLHMDFINIGDWPSKQMGRTKQGDAIYKSNYGETYVYNGKTKEILKPSVEDIEDAESYPMPEIGNVSVKLMERFAKETDLFLFAQIGGPISMVNEMLGVEDYMVYTMTNPEEIVILVKKIMRYEIEKAKLFLDAGADAILLADDMAFHAGLFLPPSVMDEVAWPFYQQAVTEIKAYKEAPVILHTDGNIKKALGQIAACGFDGIHSLQPSAGMDLREVKASYGDKLCLIGNIDLDDVLPFGTEEEVREAVTDAIQIGGMEGGYILSTCNMLMDSIPEKNVFAMYETAENSLSPFTPKRR